jgi:hypothetical protein
MNLANSNRQIPNTFHTEKTADRSAKSVHPGFIRVQSIPPRNKRGKISQISQEHGMNAHEFAATLDYPCFFYAGIGSPGGTTIAILSETELPVDLSEINGTVKKHYGVDIFTADEFDATDFGGSTIYKLQIINNEDFWKREFQEFHGIEPVTIDPTDHAAEAHGIDVVGDYHNRPTGHGDHQVAWFEAWCREGHTWDESRWTEWFSDFANE